MSHLIPVVTPREAPKIGVPTDILIAYERGELTPNEITCLGQHIYEAGAVPRLTPRYFLLVEHLKRVGLVHTLGRALQ